jgi:hypothetical protein
MMLSGVVAQNDEVLCVLLKTSDDHYGPSHHSVDDGIVGSFPLEITYVTN